MLTLEDSKADLEARLTASAVSEPVAISRLNTLVVAPAERGASWEPGDGRG